MELFAVHLKDIDQREVKVIEEVVDAETGAEGTEIVVLGYCPLFGEIAVLDRLFFNMDTTEEISSVGGCKAFHDPANWIYE